MSLPEIPAPARQAIVHGVYAGDPLSNLEELGLPLRILDLLENSKYQIVTLEDLVNRSRDEILSIKSVGEKSLEQILECLSRYDEVGQTAITSWTHSGIEAVMSNEMVPG